MWGPGTRKEPYCMAAPLTGYGSLVALAGIALGWTGSALSARGDQLVCSWGGFAESSPTQSALNQYGKRSCQSPTYQSQSSTAPKAPSEEEEDEVTVSDGDRALLLGALAGSVMMLSPFNGSYDVPPPPI